MIETNRLIIRPFNKNDLDDLFEYLSKIKVHCFLDMKVNDIKSCKKKLDERISNKNCLAVVLKKNNKVIGEVFAYEGCKNDGAEFINTFSPCWILNEKYQHHGYMYEAIYAYFSYLFKKKNARRIYAYVEEDNLASINLCKRLKMRKEAEFKEFVHFVNDKNNNPIYENTYVFAILKKEWNL